MNIAIIGFGYYGKLKYEFLKSIPNVKVSAICDTNNINLSDVNIYKDYVSCLNNENLDIVIICTPFIYNKEIIILSLKKGLHILVEKPPFSNLEELLFIRNILPEYSQQTFLIGFNHRYNQSVQKAHELIKSNILGKVISMRGIYVKNGQNNHNWRKDPNIVGNRGILFDQGIHLLDIMIQLIGCFNEYNFFKRPDIHGIENSIFLNLKTENNQIASLYSSEIEHNHLFQLEITLENGFILLSGINTNSMKYGPESIFWYHKDEKIKYQETYTKFISIQSELEYFFKNIDNKNYDLDVIDSKLISLYEILDDIYS